MLLLANLFGNRTLIPHSGVYSTTFLFGA